MEPIKQSNRRKYVFYMIGILVIVFIGVGVLLSQKINSIFSDIARVTCVYQIKVVAFSDDNADGLQSTGEAGVAGVTVNLQHSRPPDTTPEQNMTDSSGAVALNADKYCLIDDKITVNVIPPEGYSTTTVHFGPYPVPEFTNASSTQVALEPIPSPIYVPLHKT